MTLFTETIKEELDGDFFRHNFPLYHTSFGRSEDFDSSPYNIEVSAKKSITDGKELVDLTIICGSEEFIRERVEKDVAKLNEIGYPVHYICPEGYSHDFILWDKYIKLSLDELLPLNR